MKAAAFAGLGLVVLVLLFGVACVGFVSRRPR